MDPTLAGMFSADAAMALARQRDDAQHATARQRDGAAYDMRMLGAFVTAELFRSDDPGQFAGLAGALNTFARVPTTLDHPSIPVSNPMNMGGVK